MAPPLLWSESLSVLHELSSRRAISETLIEKALDRFGAMPVRREPAEPWAAIWDAASELRSSKTYDAEYVALARRLGCPVLTIHARLKRTASRLIEVVGPTEIAR